MMYIYEKWNTLLYKYMGLYILFHIYYTHYEGEYLRTEKKRYAYEHAYGGALCESRTINVLRIEEYYKINLPHPRTKRKKKAAYIRRTIIFFSTSFDSENEYSLTNGLENRVQS